MSLEAIKIISAAEDAAKRRKAEVSAEMKQALSDAEAAGQATIAAAKTKAAAELRDLREQAEATAARETADTAGSTQNRMASLRIKAESRLDQAAALIVERIVTANGH